MAEIFDLSKIKRLVEEKRPPAILIVDTNVLMDEPDFSKWGTSIGKPIFILSDIIMLELKRLRTKPKKREKAIKAIQSVNKLFRQGEITDGIVIEDVGYFISTPHPKADQLNPELEQLDDIVKAFGRFDTEFLLLTRECNQFIPNILTLFLTGEYNLFNVMKPNKIPSYMFERFPISGIEEVIKKSLIKPIDWDKELADIQTTTKGKSVEVELTLTAKTRIPKWLIQVSNFTGHGSLVIAEGYGVIHGHETGDIRFLWALPFEPYNLQFVSSDSDIGEYSSPSAKSMDIDYLSNTYLDFFGYEQQIPEQLSEALAKRISECASPVAYMEGMPTLQDPTSAMQLRLLFDYHWTLERSENRAFDGTAGDAINKLKDEIEAGGLVGAWVKWILDDQENDEDKYLFLGELLNAINSCWSIGNTVKLTIISAQKLNQDE